MFVTICPKKNSIRRFISLFVTSLWHCYFLSFTFLIAYYTSLVNILGPSMMSHRSMSSLSSCCRFYFIYPPNLFIISSLSSMICPSFSFKQIVQWPVCLPVILSIYSYIYALLSIRDLLFSRIWKLDIFFSDSVILTPYFLPYVIEFSLSSSHFSSCFHQQKNILCLAWIVFSWYYFLGHLLYGIFQHYSRLSIASIFNRIVFVSLFGTVLFMNGYIIFRNASSIHFMCCGSCSFFNMFISLSITGTGSLLKTAPGLVLTDKCEFLNLLFIIM